MEVSGKLSLSKWYAVRRRCPPFSTAVFMNLNAMTAAVLCACTNPTDASPRGGSGAADSAQRRLSMSSTSGVRPSTLC
jgi:hypothetical protein